MASCGVMGSYGMGGGGGDTFKLNAANGNRVMLLKAVDNSRNHNLVNCASILSLFAPWSNFKNPFWGQRKGRLFI